MCTYNYFGLNIYGKRGGKKELSRARLCALSSLNKCYDDEICTGRDKCRDMYAHIAHVSACKYDLLATS